MIVVLMCFSYCRNSKYIFDPENIRADLCRLITFAIKNLKCNLENIYLLTDFIPNERKVSEIGADFHQEVIDIAFPSSSDNNDREDQLDDIIDKGPLPWLLNLCNQDYRQYNSIMRQIIPEIRNSNVVEFATLFVNYIAISGLSHFIDVLQNILWKTQEDKIFLYYTGHSVKSYDGEDVQLVIPTGGDTVEYINKTEFQQLIEGIPHFTYTFFGFDSCYGESILDLAQKITFTKDGKMIKRVRYNKKTIRKDIILFTSTLGDQTCGFFENQKRRGSLFTYYLLKSLTDLPKNHDFSIFASQIETPVGEYRTKMNKPIQNICIWTGRDSVFKLPRWLVNK